MSAPIPHYLLFSEATHESSSLRDATEAGRGRWKFALEAVDGSARFEVSDEEDDLCRERLELLAVVRGLEALPQPSRVTLITASRYVCRGFRFGIAEWRENDWHWEHYGEMLPVKHADLWQRLDRAGRIHTVQCRTLRIDAPHRAAAPVQAHPTAPARNSRPVDVSSAWNLALRAGQRIKNWLRRSHVRAAQLL